MTPAASDAHMSSTGQRAGSTPPPRPTWVYVLIVAVLVAVAAFVGMHLLTGGGPGRHTPSGPSRHGPGMHQGKVPVDMPRPVGEVSR